jgi:hypothetical protein
MGQKYVKCNRPDLAFYVILKASFLNFVQKLIFRVLLLKKVTFYEINDEIWAKLFLEKQFSQTSTSSTETYMLS